MTTHFDARNNPYLTNAMNIPLEHPYTMQQHGAHPLQFQDYNQYQSQYIPARQPLIRYTPLHPVLEDAYYNAVKYNHPFPAGPGFILLPLPSFYRGHYNGGLNPVSAASIVDGTNGSQLSEYAGVKLDAPQLSGPADQLDGSRVYNYQADAVRGSGHRREDTGLYDLIKSYPSVSRHKLPYGRCVNIVEDGTNTVLFPDVPKKMLVFFCGRSTIFNMLTTSEQDNPKKQEIRVPTGSCNTDGLKAMIAWMQRACYTEDINELRPIRIRETLFHAVSLARTLSLFGLWSDKQRVDDKIFSDILPNKLHTWDIENFWDLIPQNSEYTWHMIEAIKEHLDANHVGAMHGLLDLNRLSHLLRRRPDLLFRVQTKGENDKYKPQA